MVCSSYPAVHYRKTKGIFAENGPQPAAQHAMTHPANPRTHSARAAHTNFMPPPTELDSPEDVRDRDCSSLDSPKFKLTYFIW